MLNLVPSDDPILKLKLDELDLNSVDSEWLNQLKTDLVQTMLANGGIGLAANQVGLRYRCFVMGDSVKNSRIFINPSILVQSKNRQSAIEGCLSFPGTKIKLARPRTILASYYDESKNLKNIILDNLWATCFQHELDHLNGITFLDDVV